MDTAAELKLFPYPKPGHRLSSGASVEAKQKNPERHWNHSTRVVRWMGRNALRYLRTFEVRGMAFPSVDELAAWIVEVCDPKAAKHFDSFEVARKAADAASYALSHYDPNFYERAARGGAASSTAIVLTDAQLLEVQGKSHVEAARTLNVSKSTIQRNRRTRGPVDELDALPVTAAVIHESKPGATLDDLLDPSLPVPEITIPDTIPADWVDEVAGITRWADGSIRIIDPQLQGITADTLTAWVLEGIS
ncbi:hypothetical protein [uncultured Microbacterium sp.]|uniref:hypothetical protein n=1 Tax=uncultured Microbacterium sp. TaxID=191216 RepID=UPI0028E3E911|nr:hypothetical protein [uncultured Microbacterium sp.]